MSASQGSLGGLSIIGSVSWTLSDGTGPSTAEIAVAGAPELLKGTAAPVDLRMDTRDAEETLIRDLYVLHQRPGSSPEVTVVLAADRRWLWERAHIARRYNMRRTVGVRRVGASGTPVVDPVVDDVKYHPMSLKDQIRPWRAEEILRDVLNEVMSVERDHSNAAPNIVIESSFDSLPVENLEIDDAGPDAVAQVLRFLPEAGITVDPDGTVRVYSRANGQDRRVVEDSGGPTVGHGTIEYIDFRRIRPREVRVLFTTEHEVRFNFVEVGPGGTVSRRTDDRFMDNVLPLPDFTLTIGGRTLTRGTWVPINDDLFTAWGSIPGYGSLDIDALRTAMVPYMDLWTPLRLAGLSSPDADWASRIAALQQHWRRTYRINRRWLDRIHTINAYRVATIDPTTGTRAPAPAFADFAYMHSQRSLFVQSGAQIAGAGGDIADLAVFLNVDGYADLIDDAKPAPVRVSVVDRDQGIVRLDYLVDENRIFEMALPSKLDNCPTASIRIGTTTGRPYAFNMIEEGRSSVPELSADHSVAVLLTCTPAYPNDSRQLFALTRKPGDVAALLPSALRSGIGEALGPPMEVRIRPGMETARVAWKDDRATDIERRFGVTEGDADISDLIVNLGAGDRGASLDAIADAAAARVYAMFADRHLGSKVVRLAAGATVDGFIDSIAHGIDTEGRVQTSIRMSERPSAPDMLAFLPPSVRSVLLKLVRPGKEAG